MEIIEAKDILKKDIEKMHSLLRQIVKPDKKDYIIKKQRILIYYT